ncbi:unnamed protein product [Amoebophrya sp. A120]|nr:unnamed protein product [Amoebophrya sp. A120]|eukprot:GSA120T00016909001.1
MPDARSPLSPSQASRLPQLDQSASSHMNHTANTTLQLSLDSGETPLFPFETLGAGLDFVHKRLQTENEEKLRALIGDPLTQKVDALKAENADLRKRLAVMRGEKVGVQEVFPMYENLIERQVRRNSEITKHLRGTSDDNLSVIKAVGHLSDRLDQVGMEDRRIFDLQRKLEHTERTVRTLEKDRFQLQNDKANLEYREKNLQIANELLKGKADDANAKMLHFKGLYNEKQKEMSNITHSVNYISLLSEEREIVSKRKSRIPEGGEDMWKRGFDKMRVEFMHLMRLYTMQRRKLEYAEKQKMLAQVRNKKLKADLQKAWRDMSDPHRIAAELAAATAPVPTGADHHMNGTTNNGGASGSSSSTAPNGGMQNGASSANNGNNGASQNGEVQFLPPAFRIQEETDIVDESSDVKPYELVGPGLLATGSAASSSSTSPSTGELTQTALSASSSSSPLGPPPPFDASEHFPLGNFFLQYLLSSKGDYPNLFLEDCVDADRNKCERLVYKEFVALHFRSVKVKQLLEAGAKLQEVTDADHALTMIQDIAKSFLSADRVTVWVVDAAHGLCWTRSATQQGEAFEIKIPIDKGLVGEAAMTGKPINIRDAYQDPRFNRNIDKQTGYRTKEVLCQPILVNKRVVAVLQAINKLHKVDHSSGDKSFTPVNEGFSKDDQFFLHVIGVLGKSTLDACESKQGDYLAVRRTQALLEASLELQSGQDSNPNAALSPLDCMHRIGKHMKQLFKALNVQIFVIKHKESNYLQLCKYDVTGLPKNHNFDLYQMYRERRSNPETREYLPMPWSCAFLCFRDEYVHSSILKIREEYNDEIDLPLSFNNRQLTKPNIHTFPIFKRVRSNADDQDQASKRGVMIGAIQWISNGDVSAFGDDGLFRGESSANHMGVLWKYSDILAPCVEAWQRELEANPDDTGVPKRRSTTTSEDSQGKREQNYMLFLQQKTLPKLSSQH